MSDETPTPAETPRIDNWIRVHHTTDTQPFLDFARQLERENQRLSGHLNAAANSVNDAQERIRIAEETAGLAQAEHKKALADKTVLVEALKQYLAFTRNTEIAEEALRKVGELA